MFNPVMFENENFRLEQVLQPAIPGYLILFNKTGAISLDLLPDEALKQLGPLFKKIYTAINEIIKPPRIYLTSFGEVLKDVHFHFLPRTIKMEQDFLAAHPHLQAPIPGALTFEWVREFYKTTDYVPPLEFDKSLADLSRFFARDL